MSVPSVIFMIFYGGLFLTHLGSFASANTGGQVPPDLSDEPNLQAYFDISEVSEPPVVLPVQVDTLDVYGPGHVTVTYKSHSCLRYYVDWMINTEDGNLPESSQAVPTIPSLSRNDTFPDDILYWRKLARNDDARPGYFGHASSSRLLAYMDEDGTTSDDDLLEACGGSKVTPVRLSYRFVSGLQLVPTASRYRLVGVLRSFLLGEEDGDSSRDVLLNGSPVMVGPLWMTVPASHSSLIDMAPAGSATPYTSNVTLAVTFSVFPLTTEIRLIERMTDLGSQMYSGPLLGVSWTWDAWTSRFIVRASYDIGPHLIDGGKPLLNLISYSMHLVLLDASTISSRSVLLNKSSLIAADGSYNASVIIDDDFVDPCLIYTVYEASPAQSTGYVHYGGHSGASLPRRINNASDWDWYKFELNGTFTDFYGEPNLCPSKSMSCGHRRRLWKVGHGSSDQSLAALAIERATLCVADDSSCCTAEVQVLQKQCQSLAGVPFYVYYLASHHSWLESDVGYCIGSQKPCGQDSGPSMVYSPSAGRCIQPVIVDMRWTNGGPILDEAAADSPGGGDRYPIQINATERRRVYSVEITSQGGPRTDLYWHLQKGNKAVRQGEPGFPFRTLSSWCRHSSEGCRDAGSEAAIIDGFVNRYELSMDLLPSAPAYITASSSPLDFWSGQGDRVDISLRKLDSSTSPVANTSIMLLQQSRPRLTLYQEQTRFLTRVHFSVYPPPESVDFYYLMRDSSSLSLIPSELIIKREDTLVASNQTYILGYDIDLGRLRPESGPIRLLIKVPDGLGSTVPLLLKWTDVPLDDSMCTNYKMLGGVRSELYNRSGEAEHTPGSAFTVEDTDLDRGSWYRVCSPEGDDLLQTCPKLDRCGCRYPVYQLTKIVDWESQPYRGSNGVTNVTLRTVVTSNTCSSSSTAFDLTVQVRNCGIFRVYRLRRLDPNSCYCVGGATMSVLGQYQPEGASEANLQCTVSNKRTSIVWRTEEILSNNQVSKVQMASNSEVFSSVYNRHRILIGSQPDGRAISILKISNIQQSDFRKYYCLHGCQQRSVSLRDSQRASELNPALAVSAADRNGRLASLLFPPSMLASVLTTVSVVC